MANSVLQAFSFRNASAIWVLAVIMAIFSLTIPQTFLASRTWTSMLDTQAVVALAAVALVIPLSAGIFNLAVGGQIGIASMMVAWLLVSFGLPIAVAIPLTLLAGGLIGLVTGVLIVHFRIDSFIATLGMNSLLIAAVNLMSGGRQILDMPQPLVDFGTTRFAGLTYSFLLMIVLSALVWYVLERTASRKAGLRDRCKPRSGAPFRRQSALGNGGFACRVRVSDQHRRNPGHSSAGQCRPDDRPGLFASRVHRCVPWRNAVPARPLQCHRNHSIGLCARGRRQRTATIRSADMDHGCIQRLGASGSRRPRGIGSRRNKVLVTAALAPTCREARLEFD